MGSGLLAAPVSADDGFEVGDESESSTPGDGDTSPGTQPDGSQIDIDPRLFDYRIVYGREEVGQEAGFDVAGCWGVVETDSPDGLSYAEAAAGADEWGGNGSGQGRCVDDPVEVFDLDAYVRLVWETMVVPPPPTPLRVAPGKAITGLRSYLEIGGDVPWTVVVPNPIGADITLTAESRYEVAWGDGATAETTSQGVPWPGGAGEISHVYTDAGGLTVTVDAYWHASWRGGDRGGDLAELPTPTVASLDLAIEERQPVVD